MTLSLISFKILLLSAIIRFISSTDDVVIVVVAVNDADDNRSAITLLEAALRAPLRDAKPNATPVVLGRTVVVGMVPDAVSRDNDANAEAAAATAASARSPLAPSRGASVVCVVTAVTAATPVVLGRTRTFLVLVRAVVATVSWSISSSSVVDRRRRRCKAEVDVEVIIPSSSSFLDNAGVSALTFMISIWKFSFFDFVREKY